MPNTQLVTPLKEEDIYIDYSGYVEGDIRLRKNTANGKEIWLEFGHKLCVCLTLNALAMLEAMIKEFRDGNH